jgi:hypothetical protein
VKEPVGHFRAGVADGAAFAFEDSLSGEGVGGERSVGGAMGALRDAPVVEAGEIGGERVEIGIEPGLGCPERGRGRGELRVCQEPGAAEVSADVVFEVLDLVEVRGPVDVALSGPGASVERGGVAEPLAPAGEVPGAPVETAVGVAGGAGEIPFAAHAWIAGMVEDPLAAKDRAGKDLGGGGGDALAGEVRPARGEKAGQFEDGEVAPEVVLDEEPSRHRIDREAARGASDTLPRHESTESRGAVDVKAVEDGEVVVPLQRREKVVVEGPHGDGAGGVAVVEVDRFEHLAGGGIDEG